MDDVTSHLDRSIKCICLLTSFAYLQLHPFTCSLCKCFFKCTQWTFVFYKLRMDIVLFRFFFVCVCPNCKPHGFSGASYMLLHVQDYRERRYTGPGIQSMPVYHAMEIQNTNGRCWMTSAFICFFGRRFLVEANCTKGWLVFIRPKRICVSVSDGESLTNSCHSFTTAKWI